VLSDSVADTIHDTNLQVKALIIPEAQDNDRVRQRPIQTRCACAWALPDGAGGALKCLYLVTRQPVSPPALPPVGPFTTRAGRTVPSAEDAAGADTSPGRQRRVRSDRDSQVAD